MRYFFSSRELISLPLILLLITSCVSQTYLTPEESLQNYINLIAEGRLEEASVLRYAPLREWVNLKEVLGAVLVLGLLGVAIRLTGLNPFVAMLQCRIIEKTVSPENRKYVLVGVVILWVVMGVGFYKFLESFLKNTVLELDALMLEGVVSVEVLGSEVRGKSAFVSYELTYEDGKTFRKKAELKLQGGVWRVVRL